MADIELALRAFGANAESDDTTQLDSETSSAILHEAATFADRVLAPLDAIGDRDGCRFADGRVMVPPGFAQAFSQFAASGWAEIDIAPELGGQGLPAALAWAVCEMFAGANPALSMAFMPISPAVRLIRAFGTPEQQATYISKLVNAEWGVAMTMSEPQAGSDLGAILTRAERDGDGFRLFGQKMWITFGEHDMTDNIVHLALARIAGAAEGVRGLSLFLVRKLIDDRANEIACIGIERKMGLHGSPTTTLVFDGARAELLGEENRGLEEMFSMLDHARLAVGVFALGSSEGALQSARDYAATRIAGRDVNGNRVAIDAHPDVRRMLGEMASRTNAARALSYYVASLTDAGDVRRANLLTPIVKGWCSESAIVVTSAGVQIHGGMGFSNESPASQHFRDSRAHAIYEGATAIQANDFVLRKVVGDSGSALLELLDEIDAIGGDSLTPAIADVRDLTAWMIERAATDRRLVLAGAVPYLLLVGSVVGAWLLARAAAGPHVCDVDDEPARRLRASAQFFLAHVLPYARAARNVVLHGGDLVNEYGSTHVVAAGLN